MAGNDRVWFRAKDSLIDHIDDYADDEGYEDRSKAVRKLVKEGLEQSATPVRRWRSAVQNAAAQLIFVSVALVVIGYGTDLVDPLQSLQVSGLLVAIALSVLAVLEAARQFTTPTFERDGGAA